MAKQIELFDTFPIRVGAKAKDLMLSDSKKEVKSGYSLVCEVDATHSGTLINNRIYPPEEMKKGLHSWTSPYKKPVLFNHDDTKDPIGRVISAHYEKTQRAIESRDYKPILRESDGYGFQRLTAKITDPDAIQKILDGRYETVSVRMSTNHCWCSVCDTDWSDGEPCEHTPGTKYEGKLCFMTTGELTYREMSFVNIPADEYAGVKEAIMSDDRNTTEVSLYANNDSEKVLADLGNGQNLYSLLDAEAEASDDIVTYLLDKSNKIQIIDKEEDVKITELTKDQLKDLELVKAMITEAVDAAKKECEDGKKKCQDSVAELQKMIEDAKKKKEEDEEDEDAKKKKGMKENEEEEEDAKKKKVEKEEEEDEDAKKKKESEEEEEDEDAKKKVKEAEEEEEEEEEEEDEDAKKKKGKTSKGAPVPNVMPENKGKGKTGGVKHGAGNQSPVGEDPGDSKLLDENVKINAELHKVIAERLYDLKKILRKPDVVGITTPDARDKKVEEFSQRSIDSLKDQIKDLLIEQDNALAAGLYGKDIENPSISVSDITNEVMEDKKKATEGKRETLTRLFPKSK
jgi:hypothetical protein